MGWHRVDDGFPDHVKLLPLERDPRLWADAIALWLAAACYCRRARTRGHISLERIGRLTPMGQKRERTVADALVDQARATEDGAGLWERTDDGYRFHDWEDYGPASERPPTPPRGGQSSSSAERTRRWRASQKASRGDGGDASHGDVTERHGDASHVTDGDGHGDVTEHRHGDGHGDASPRARTAARGRPDPGSRRVNPPLKPPPCDAGDGTGAVTGDGHGDGECDAGRDAPSGKPLRDPMVPVGNRADVQELHEAWKLAVNQRNHKLRSAYGGDAATLADALDTYGRESCLLVAEHCMSDPMVNGKGDDKGLTHKTIGYIFGNNDAFNRILHAALEQAGKTSGRRSPSEVYAEAIKL